MGFHCIDLKKIAFHTALIICYFREKSAKSLVTATSDQDRMSATI
jgi:hypothetical protein